MALTAANIANLETARDNLCTELATATASGVISPNYSKGNQSVSFADYLASLVDRIKAIDDILDAYSTDDPANFEVITQMY